MDEKKNASADIRSKLPKTMWNALCICKLETASIFLNKSGKIHERYFLKPATKILLSASKMAPLNLKLAKPY